MKLLDRMRLLAVLACLLALLGAAIVFGLLSGPSALDPSTVWQVLTASPTLMPEADILFGVRLPRIGLAIVVGAALATSGVVFQALLRNPLADPFILGVSGGSALGAILMLSFGAGLGWGYESVPPAAFVGGLFATFLLFLFAGSGNRVSTTGLLLTGVVFNAIASAAIVFVASLSGLEQGGRIFLWLIGNLSSARIDAMVWVATLLLLGFTAVWVSAPRLNLLALGDESASQLGVEVETLKRWLLLATSLMVGAAVSVSGLIGFVGLIVPHLLRLVVGPDHRLLVPASALVGAAFLVVCDTVARSWFGGRELPVGAVTALLGGPLFLVLLHRGARGVWADEPRG